ncbi:MAG: MMPL family transporter, partial [Oscillospiraceae bacterium]|nr:MMPL family transporter [Oscillospiraceae bacterium]
MEIFTKAITGHRKLVAAVFAIAALVCAVMLLGVDVNYDLAAYLPEGTASTIAIDVMGSEFTGAFQNARVMVRGVGVAEALRYKRELAALDGVADVLWLDDVMDITQPVEMADGELVEQYYSNGNALFSLTISGDELEATDRIYGVIGEDNALSGEAVSRGAVRVTMNTETTNAMLILVPMILVILLVSTTSWLEPLLFFAAIGISVLINMGTNALFKEISFVTFAISPILQLAVSLDYAIFLLHAFEDYRKQTDDVAEAMR